MRKQSISGVTVGRIFEDWEFADRLGMIKTEARVDARKFSVEFTHRNQESQKEKKRTFVARGAWLMPLVEAAKKRFDI